MRFTRLHPLLLLTLLAPLGCKSTMIQATVHNGTPTPLSVLEVDYPSASFGTQTLAPGADFHYQFKIIGSGPLTLSYTDSANAQHTFKGPDLHEGDHGRLVIAVTTSGVRWTPPVDTSGSQANTPSTP